jgi:hypothetical protein
MTTRPSPNTTDARRRVPGRCGTINGDRRRFALRRPIADAALRSACGISDSKRRSSTKSERPSLATRRLVTDDSGRHHFGGVRRTSACEYVGA